MVLMCLDWWKKQANFSTTVDRKKVWCSDCARSHAGSVSLKKNKLCPTWGLLEDSRVGAPMTKNTGQWRQWSEREDGAAIASSARGAWWLVDEMCEAHGHHTRSLMVRTHARQYRWPLEEHGHGLGRRNARVGR
jgi:hypothetical protein